MNHHEHVKVKGLHGRTQMSRYFFETRDIEIRFKHIELFLVGMQIPEAATSLALGRLGCGIYEKGSPG